MHNSQSQIKRTALCFPKTLTTEKDTPLLFFFFFPSHICDAALPAWSWPPDGQRGHWFWTHRGPYQLDSSDGALVPSPKQLCTSGQAEDQRCYRAVTLGTKTVSSTVSTAKHKTDDRGTSFTYLSPFPSLPPYTCHSASRAFPGAPGALDSSSSHKGQRLRWSWRVWDSVELPASGKPFQGLC